MRGIPSRCTTYITKDTQPIALSVNGVVFILPFPLFPQTGLRLVINHQIHQISSLNTSVALVTKSCPLHLFYSLNSPAGHYSILCVPLMATALIQAHRNYESFSTKFPSSALSNEQFATLIWLLSFSKLISFFYFLKPLTTPCKTKPICLNQ